MNEGEKKEQVWSNFCYGLACIWMIWLNIVEVDIVHSYFIFLQISSHLCYLFLSFLAVHVYSFYFHCLDLYVSVNNNKNHLFMDALEQTLNLPRNWVKLYIVLCKFEYSCVYIISEFGMCSRYHPSAVQCMPRAIEYFDRVEIVQNAKKKYFMKLELLTDSNVKEWTEFFKWN